MTGVSREGKPTRSAVHSHHCTFRRHFLVSRWRVTELDNLQEFGRHMLTFGMEVWLTFLVQKEWEVDRDNFGSVQKSPLSLITHIYIKKKYPTVSKNSEKDEAEQFPGLTYDSNY